MSKQKKTPKFSFSVFESPEQPKPKEGKIEIEEMLRQHVGRVREQEIRSETYATREWVYTSFLKYIVPSMLLLIGVVFAYLVKFNETLIRAIVNSP